METNPYKSPAAKGVVEQRRVTPLRSRQERLQRLFRGFGVVCAIVAMGSLWLVFKNYGSLAMFRPLLAAAASIALSAILFYLAKIMPEY